MVAAAGGLQPQVVHRRVLEIHLERVHRRPLPAGAEGQLARLVGAPITVRAEEQASQLGAVEIDRRHQGSSALDRELPETV